MNITIKEVNEKLYREFKAKAARKGMKMGEAINEAMMEWVKEEKVKKRIADIKPFDWGEGTEKLSSKIDEVLYGD